MDKDREEIWMMIKMVLFLMAIIVLVWTTMTLLKNKDIIIADPLTYGMEVRNFSSCQCLDQQGGLWYSTENGFVHQKFIDYRGERIGAG